MKKLVFIFTVAMMLCSSVAMAQRVDVDEINAKLAKSDADSQHVKKGIKASTWINRGDLYFKSITEPTSVLFDGVDVPLVELQCGKGKAAQKQIGSTQYKTLTYPYFTAYVLNNKVVSWTVTKQINKEAMDTALASYSKALEIDPSSADRVKESLEVMVNYYKQLGAVSITINDVKSGSTAYLNACKVQEHEGYNDKVDPTMLFYAGYMLTIQSDDNPNLCAKGENTLKKALEGGYLDIEDANADMSDADRGNLYYYLYHCAYGQREKTPAKVETAKKYLQDGIAKYPKNERIFEGLLQIYTNEEGMGDPMELLGTIEEMIKINPKSVNAWFAKGRIHYALKNYDECIEAFGHVIELQPKAFDGNFYMGLFHMLKGDDLLDEMKGISYTDQSKYDADVAKLNKMYGEAIPYFEVAYEANPTHKGTLEYLKQLCFRLREEPGIMEKYTKYNELYKAME